MLRALVRVQSESNISKARVWSKSGVRKASIVFRNCPPSRSTATLKPPVPPDISKGKGVDLDEVVGVPGWRLEDLLPPRRERKEGGAENGEITPRTLNFLLDLSGLPHPQSSAEKASLLSALQDQLHFVKHVQSVPTDNVEPLVRIGNEGNTDGIDDRALSYKECLEEHESGITSGPEWTPWEITGLKGGSREGREEGWFIVHGRGKPAE